MAIAKRLNSKERERLARKRLRDKLPKQYRSALRHPLMQRISNFDKFDTTPENMVDAIEKVTKWKGASYIQKIFVLGLDIVLEKGTGEGVLEPDTYNRLWDHLLNNEPKLDFHEHQTFVWDIYHDHFGLNNYQPGELALPEPPRKIKLKRKLKRK